MNVNSTPADLDSLRQRVESLLFARGAAELPESALSDLVIIGSSSRGGSSILAEALRRQPGLLHFRAEVNPFFRLAGLGHPESGTGSDALGQAELGRRIEVSRLRRYLLADIGRPLSSLGDDGDRHRYSMDLHLRFVLQWPTLDIDLPTVRLALDRGLEAQGWQNRGGEPWEVGDPRALVALVVRELRARGAPINPYAYDVDLALLRELFPEHPGGYEPDGLLIEEPPFVAISPWASATEEELHQYTVVMKTPSNVWRLPLLAGLFSRARLRVLHLRRNVASSVNGLFDGWNHPGFHSHPFSDGRGGTAWWKFDLPPGWERWVGASSLQRCAWQWRSAHAAILDFLRHNPTVPWHSLHFEDLLQGGKIEADSVRELSQWLGVGLPLGLLDGVPAVMATAPPRRRRWFARVVELGPVLEDPLNINMM